MSQIKQRLSRLEKQTGAKDRACTCFRNHLGIRPRTIVYCPEAGAEVPSSICEGCGGQMHVIRLVYEKPAFPNYQMVGESSL
jgi:hypothetical protein